MLRDFKELFREFLGRRTEEFYGLYKLDNDYLKAEYKSEEAYNNFETSLNKDQDDLFIKYDEQNNYECALVQELIYRHGVNDGFKNTTSNYENLFDKECNEQIEKTFKDREKLEKTLNNEQIKLYIDYEQKNADVEVARRRIIYIQGLKDGQSLRDEIIGSIGVEV